MSVVFPINPDPRFRLSTAVGGETSFSVPFPFQDNRDIALVRYGVYGSAVPQIEGVHYTLSGAGSPAGGTATLMTPMAAGEKMLRVGAAILDRVTSIIRNGRFASEAMDTDLDRWIIIAQELARETARSWKAPYGQTGGAIVAGAVGTVPKFDDAGNLVEGPDGSEIEHAQDYAEQALTDRMLAQAAADRAESAASSFSEIRTNFKTVPVLQANTTMKYSGSGSDVIVGAGDIVTAQGFRYQVAAFAATDHHVETAGGVKLYALPDARGLVAIAQVGGVAGAADSSSALVTAFKASSKVELGEGVWNFKYVSCPSGAELHGVPGQTIVRPQDPDDRAALTWDSGSASVFLTGIKLDGIRFEGSVAANGFAEQKHLVTMHGVDGVDITCCEFIGFRGDGLYLGSSDSGGATERHNRNVRVDRCVFDGVNNDNRNGISVIDGDGIWITRNEFRNCTRSNMPGPIDFEPNGQPFKIIRNLYVEENRFVNCGGNVGMIAVYMAAAMAAGAAAPYNINILNNVQEGGQQVGLSAFFFASANGVNPTAGSRDWGINIEGNYGVGGGTGGAPLYLVAVKGVDASDNAWVDYPIQAIVGLSGANQFVREISIRDKFIRCGNSVDSAVDVGNADGVDFSGSVFDDCANGVGNACAINFKSGASSRVKLNDFRVTSPTGRTIRATLKDGGHTFAPESNECFGIDIGALPIDFQAVQSDCLWTSYSPIIEWATTAGSGTYTTQFGRYRRQGKNVTFQAKVVQTAHTGTGIAELSLPTTVASASGNAEMVVPVTATGVSSSGGIVGLINPIVDAGGKGAVRFFSEASGTQTGVAVPAGAATFWASGNFEAA